MKLIYLSAARFPDEWAHGLQIMKMCEVFAECGAEVLLIAPYRARTLRKDPFEYYGVKKNFRLIKLPCIDLFAGTQSKSFFYLRNFSFLFFARLYLWLKSYGVLYTRETQFLSFMPRAKAVVELHSVPEHERTVRQIAAMPKAVVITHGIKDKLVQKNALPRMVLVAPDAVDLTQFAHPETKAAARARLSLSQDAQIALYVGRVDGWKGVGIFCEAATLLPDVLFAVIGGEPDQIESLRARFPRVKFLGFRPYTELAANQAAADVLILPNTAKDKISAYFTSPLKLFSYMAAGRPIVASDLPSIREILDESTAVLVKPDDPQALADGIKKVLNDPAFGERLAAAAKEKVKNYTWEKRAKKILEFISRT